MIEVIGCGSHLSRSLKHAWFQKRFVHRMARPEEIGWAWCISRLTGARTASQYPLDSQRA